MMSPSFSEVGVVTEAGSGDSSGSYGCDCFGITRTSEPFFGQLGKVANA